MPDLPDPSRRKHPAKREAAAGGRGRRRRQEYVELRCKSNFSFLRGASHPEELVERAGELGYPAIGLADLETLAGVVRMHVAAKAAGLKLLVGAEMRPADGPPLALYAMNRRGYGRLSRLITTGRRRAPKGECHIVAQDVLAEAEDLIGIVFDATGRDDEAAMIARYRAAFGDRLYWGAQLHRGADDRRELERFAELARRHRLPVVAVNDVHYETPAGRYLQDVLVCIREGCTLADAGKRLFPNGERYLKSAAQMAELFGEHAAALARTLEIADRCRFSLDELRYEYPPELCPPGKTPFEYLEELTWSGAARRYPNGVPKKVRRLLEHELVLIRQLAYEHYFLTVWDLVTYARGRGILCQGRGSAANSAVCFCLGVTSVDPDRIDLLFERFLSAERNEPPDIDVDFEHERREEVLQYVYRKYGRDRAGITAEVITYRPKSAVRDVGKALGFSLDRVDAIAKKVEWWSPSEQLEGHMRAAGLDPAEPAVRMLMRLTERILGFPRHLSQHVGGFVITAGPLTELVPIGNAAMPDRTFIEWDKDDIDALGILKVDCLGLGMLTAIRKCFDLIAQLAERPELVGGRSDAFAASLPGRDANERLALVPAEDPAVYEMICRADTVGVFQIESRAQMSMLPRLRPRCFYDLVIEVAIVRPGPIQGGMVHPYLRRRNGEEPVSFPSEAVASVLKKTLGVPLFQEQAMKLAVVAAGFSPGEADQLRRSMAAWRRTDSLDKFRGKLISGMLANGYSPEFAEQLFKQIRGFGEYGFPESHAASFALLVYVSCWMKRYYPACFAAAVINSQPMGFYAPAQLVRDAREHGVTVRGVDVNASHYDCTLEPDEPAGSDEAAEPGESPKTWGRGGPAVRLGFRLIKGLAEGVADALVKGRADGPYRSVRDVQRRSGVSPAALARLAAADAFGSLGLDRRTALWEVLALEEELPLLAGLDPQEDRPALPKMTLPQQVVEDYARLGLSLKAHPIGLIRGTLQRAKIVPAAAVKELPQGRRVNVAGLVLIRQRPSTALGVVFMTIEDETGTANLVIRPKVYERFRATARSAVAVVATGRIERQGEVVNIQVEKLVTIPEWVSALEMRSRDFH